LVQGATLYLATLTKLIDITSHVEKCGIVSKVELP